MTNGKTSGHSDRCDRAHADDAPCNSNPSLTAPTSTETPGPATFDRVDDGMAVYAYNPEFVLNR